MQLLWLSLALLVALAATPQVRSLVWLNLAQLERLKGDHRASLHRFNHALSISPEDSYIRWQTAAAFARTGDLNEAADTLLPLADSSNEDQVIELLLSCLTKAGRIAEAARVYRQTRVTPKLSPRVAAATGLALLESGTDAPPQKLSSVLLQALGLAPHSPQAQLLAETVEAAGFWSKGAGRRIKETLKWRAALDSPAASSIAAKPGTETALEQIAAALLKVPPANLNLGNELVVNCGFEQTVTDQTVRMGGRPHR